MAAATLTATMATGLATPAGAAEAEARPIADAVARLTIETTGAPVDALWTGGSAGERRAATNAEARQSDPAPTRSRGRRVGRAIAGAAVGAVGGAFAGGYLGAAIDGDCGGCDDPGLKGFLIGFPVGGVVGGVLGGFFLFR
jgi:hypothetical protein